MDEVVLDDITRRLLDERTQGQAAAGGSGLKKRRKNRSSRQLQDGILLLEVNRMLRAGGYFAWAAQPVSRHKALLEERWEEMVNLTSHLCWNFVEEGGYIAIWKKPLNNSCYLSQKIGNCQSPLTVKKSCLGQCSLSSDYY